MAMPMPKEGERICITLPFAGLRAMQVCVMAEVPDSEILEFCQANNPATIGGSNWHSVVRDAAHARELGVDECSAPGNCVECPGRVHKIVIWG